MNYGEHTKKNRDGRTGGSGREHRRRLLLTAVLLFLLCGLLAGCGEARRETVPHAADEPETYATAPAETDAPETDGPEETQTTEAETEPETEDPYTRRQRAETSWFTEEELRLAGNRIEKYYAEKGRYLVSVTFDQKESPYLGLYGDYEQRYGGGNVMILEVEVKLDGPDGKKDETVGAVVLTRSSGSSFSILEELAPRSGTVPAQDTTADPSEGDRTNDLDSAGD